MSGAAGVGRVAGWAALYLGLAVAWTWPLAAHLGDHLPKGDVPTSLPASAGAWALWWVADRLAVGFVGLWDAPIFHPAAGAFGYSETTLPLGVLAAPLLWAGVEPAPVYNLVVLGCIAVNGLAARALARTLGAGELAAGLGGALAATCPLTQVWISVLPLVPLFGVVSFVRAVIRYGQDPSARAGAAVGATFALTALLCLQYALFVALVAPLLAVVVRWRAPGALAGVAAGAAVAACLAGPALLPQRAILAEAGFQRTEQRSERGAFAPSSWGSVLVAPRLGLPGPTRTDGTPLYPGTVPLLLAAVGVAANVRRREVVAVVGVSAAAALLATLPNLGDAGARGWELLRDAVPGLAQIREGKRAGAITVALFPALAALGVDVVARWRWGRWGVVGALAVSALDQMPPPAPLQPAPTVVAHRGLLDAIAAHVPPDGVLVFLPFDDPSSPTPEVDRMLLQAAHGRRMVNGYSSYYPPTYWALRRDVTRRNHADALRAAGVTHAVLPADAPPLRGGGEPLWRGEGRALYGL